MFCLLEVYCFLLEVLLFIVKLLDDDFDVAPQHWTNGYLVGVESMYLSGKTSAAGWQDDLYVSLVMECQSETLSQSAAMALALSQG